MDTSTLPLRHAILYTFCCYGLIHLPLRHLHRSIQQAPSTLQAILRDRTRGDLILTEFRISANQTITSSMPSSRFLVLMSPFSSSSTSHRSLFHVFAQIGVAETVSRSSSLLASSIIPFLHPDLPILSYKFFHISIGSASHAHPLSRRTAAPSHLSFPISIFCSISSSH